MKFMSKNQAKRQKRAETREKSRASSTYTMTTALLMLRYAAMIGIIILFIQFGDDINARFGMEKALMAATVIEVLLFLAGKPLEKSRQKARSEVAYDENGMSKEYGDYQTLSRKEREALDKERVADAERVLSSGEISKMTKRGSVNPDDDLKKLIGLPQVKRQIEEMSARMEFEKNAMKGRKDTANPLSSMHMLFIGNPGTGKTTVARIMAGFLYKNGYIKQNAYIETDGNTLRGYGPGETTKRTELILSRAKGKLLFIDEAYAMFSGQDAQEAIATLVKTMENDRSQFVLILAGYKKEMKVLMDANSGFFSRFGYVIDFPDYTETELQDIFLSMAHENGFYVPAETMERFATRIRKEKTQKNFGNARTCRNILDKAVSAHALNLRQGVHRPDKIYTLCPEDIDLNTTRVL